MRHCIEKFQLTLDVPTRKMEWFCVRLKDKIISEGTLEFTFVLLFPNHCTSPKAPSTNGLFQVIAHTAYSDLPFLPTTGIAWNEGSWAWWVTDTLKCYIYPRLFKIYLIVQFKCQVQVGMPICQLWSFVYMGERWGQKVGRAEAWYSSTY